MIEPTPLVAVALALLAGCATVDAPVSATATLTAAEGGAVTLEDGATVTVPAGALAVDGPVTLTRETCGGVYAGSAFAGCLYSVQTPALAGRFAIAMPVTSRAGDPIAVVRRDLDGLRPLIDSATVDGAGTVHFGADGSFSIGSAAVIHKHTIIATRCLATVDETCSRDCERRGGLCDCLWDFAEGSSFAEAAGWGYGDAGTVSVDGTPFRYCVDGDTLTLEYANYQGPYTMIYTRQ